MNITELYEAGRLDEAIQAAVDDVKKHPADVVVRSRLCHLLCLAGDLPRADKQLDVMAQQNPKAAVGVQLFRQLIRAETARRQFYESGRVPEFLDKPSPVLERHLEASIYVRNGDMAKAGELLAAAAEQFTPPSGECDGVPFDMFRDGDDLLAPLLEVYTCNGGYYWVALERFDSIDLRPVESLRDMIWRPIRAAIRNGPPEAELFIPTLYHGSHQDPDPEVRLGRATHWTGGEAGPVLGRGVRTFLVGEGDKTVLEMQSVRFHWPESQAP
jgi:type VI secretion system protein ImpE